MPKKGNLINPVSIIDLIPGGEARGQAIDDAGMEYQIYFDARTVAPGDIVCARLLGKRDKRWQGRVETIEQYSENRRQPACPHFGICGGCTLQHIPYATQVSLKEKIVKACLESLPDTTVWLPPVPCLPGSEFAFRNKMEFTASARAYQTDPAAIAPAGPGAIGLFVPFCGNKVLNVTDCRLQLDTSNAMRNWLRERAEASGLSYYHSSRHDGYLRTMLIRSNLQGEFLVMFVVAEDIPELTLGLCKDFAAAFPQARSVYYLLNTKLNDSYADLVPVHAAGEHFIVEQLGTLNFTVGPLTFLQVNSGQTKTLYDRILDFAGLRGDELVYDLYCGVGTITAWLAPATRQIIGIEYVEASVIAARQACQDNDIQNASFFAGDMKDMLAPGFFAVHGQADVIITDPPRAGMHPKACQVLADSGARRIVYVSCNPVSLARDLSILVPKYRVSRIQVVDLMPQSHHIETLVLLELP